MLKYKQLTLSYKHYPWLYTFFNTCGVQVVF
jgi:hypothetical protein